MNFAQALVHRRILPKAPWNSRDFLIFSFTIVCSSTYLTVVACILILWPMKSEEILLWEVPFELRTKVTNLTSEFFGFDLKGDHNLHEI